jgi:hypothetical protein
MPADRFAHFFPLICAGFGLLLAGGVNLLLIRRGFAIRAVATLVAALVAILAASASEIGLAGMTVITARMLVLVLIPFFVLGNSRFIAAVNTSVTLVHRPIVRFSLLAFVGVSLLVGSIMAYSQADETCSEEGPSEQELLGGNLKSLPSGRASAATDLGTKLVLRELSENFDRDNSELSTAEERILHRTNLDESVIRRGAADDQSNCHGWVFTGGRFLLYSADVALILRENGYLEQKIPMPGDLVVYREERGILHTAIVRYVTDGQPILVESKWGELGIFLHAVDKSVYGRNYTYYRSPRNGHLLFGIDPRP